MFLYLLKVNIALVLFYLAYCYGLRRLTFYTLNRFYLLFAIGFSSVYPLIDLSGLIKRREVKRSITCLTWETWPRKAHTRYGMYLHLFSGRGWQSWAPGF
ncbi:hypothetical protein EDD80_104188 [Anseongella ginsenosidimutans]|uniref:Uncharacterized protein n=1 Tax=Anseongella ginsenosidimutans TaxID=496056 RepID=A0A4R3KVF4_9SPHI|nr:hypothetical protein EDD80_104188 [Anseongella ginsenosidimutans]